MAVESVCVSRSMLSGNIFRIEFSCPVEFSVVPNREVDGVLIRAELKFSDSLPIKTAIMIVVIYFIKP